MKNLFLLLIFFAMTGVSYADTWAGPVERLYLSKNKRFVANVIPAKDNSPAMVKVFQISDKIGWIHWQCDLGNEGAPQEVFFSDDGKYVVTVNENSRRVHGGMGDFVLAFYQRKGLIRNYSLEKILHYPDKINEKEFNKLISRSVSGRGWVTMPMLLTRYKDKLHFCLWLSKGKRWLAWEVSTGEEVEINEDMLELFDEKGLLWAREYNIGSQASLTSMYSAQALSILGRFKKAEDRKFIESFLADKDFNTGYVERNKKFISYYSWSGRRSQIDEILAEWDGKPATESSRTNQKYHYLGVVEGAIELPRPPEAGDHCLCIYLIPTAITKSEWFNEVPAHRLVDSFSKYSFNNMEWPGRNIPFRILGVTPGEYRITAVWDLVKPYTFGSDYIKGPPQKGDYQSIESPVITIKAGEIIEGINIDCLQKVTGESQGLRQTSRGILNE